MGGYRTDVQNYEKLGDSYSRQRVLRSMLSVVVGLSTILMFRQLGSSLDYGINPFFRQFNSVALCDNLHAMT